MFFKLNLHPLMHSTNQSRTKPTSLFFPPLRPLHGLCGEQDIHIQYRKVTDRTEESILFFFFLLKNIFINWTSGQYYTNKLCISVTTNNFLYMFQKSFRYEARLNLLCCVFLKSKTFIIIFLFVRRNIKCVHHHYIRTPSIVSLL